MSPWQAVWDGIFPVYPITYIKLLNLFPECVAKGSRFTFGGLGVETCSHDPASGVRNRPRTTVMAEKLACLLGEPQKQSKTCQKMWSCRFAWQAWRFVTFDVFQEECVCAAVLRVKLSCL